MAGKDDVGGLPGVKVEVKIRWKANIRSVQVKVLKKDIGALGTESEGLTVK
jgi:hypothetical protein